MFHPLRPPPLCPNNISPPSTGGFCQFGVFTYPTHANIHLLHTPSAFSRHIKSGAILSDLNIEIKPLALLIRRKKIQISIHVFFKKTHVWSPARIRSNLASRSMLEAYSIITSKFGNFYSIIRVPNISRIYF